MEDKSTSSSTKMYQGEFMNVTNLFAYIMGSYIVL